MAGKSDKVLFKSLAAQSVDETLKGKETITRKEILDVASKLLLEKCKEKKLTEISKNSCRCEIGTVLSEFEEDKKVSIKEGKVTVKQDDALKVTREECKAALIQILENKPLKKDEVFEAVIKTLGADKTKSDKDDDRIKCYVGQILSELVKDETLVHEERAYTFSKANKYPTKPMPEDEFKKVFLQRLFDNGGPFFEKFLANMIELYYNKTGRDVLDSKLIGGTEDGGIDIVLRISDELGFVETVMIQAKCKSEGAIKEKTIREFYGAVKANKGTRGIFVTTSDFCSSAAKLLNKIDDCVGIDGDKLWEIVKTTSYGIHQSNSGFKFNEMLFDI